jgi:hypothetical protein
VRVFIGVSALAYMRIYVCTVFLKKVYNPLHQHNDVDD